MPTYPLPRHRDGRKASISDGFHKAGDKTFRKGVGHRGVDMMYRKPSASDPTHPYSSKWYEIPDFYDVPILAPVTGRIVLVLELETGWFVALNAGGGVGFGFHHGRKPMVEAGPVVGEGTPLMFVGGSPRKGDYGLWHLHADKAKGCPFDVARMRRYGKLDGTFEDPAGFFKQCRHVTLEEVGF